MVKELSIFSGTIRKVIISDANDGDETFPMFYVRFGAFTTLLHASEFAPVAEAEAQLWACRQIDGPGADVDALRGRLRR